MSKTRFIAATNSALPCGGIIHPMRRQGLIWIFLEPVAPSRVKRGRYSSAQPPAASAIATTTAHSLAAAHYN